MSAMLASNILRHFPKFKLSCTYCTCEGDKTIHRKGLVLGAYDGEEGTVLSGAGMKYSDTLGGKLRDLVAASGKEISKARGRCFSNLGEYWSVCVVGLGPQTAGVNPLETLDEDRENVRIAAAIGSKILIKQGCQSIYVDGMSYPEQAAEGSALAIWKYQDNKNKDDRQLIPNLELFEDPNVDQWQQGLFKADSQNLVRKICDTPANQMTPFDFAQETVNELCPCGIKVSVYDKDWIESKKMYSFLKVAKGSCAPPLFVEIQYSGGATDTKPILLAGKGITFDAGGLCLKPCRHMSTHRGDLAGAAIVMSTIRAAAALSLPLNIIGVLPLCENMPSGMAMKCGDVVWGQNGKSIQIEDCDNEGRLCLADALVYGQLTYKPNLIIDLSTESQGVVNALAASATGVFCTSEAIWSQVQKAGSITGDRVWRLPLWNYFYKNIVRGRTVDVANKGIGEGDACLAAAFLREFIMCGDWLHLDIMGTGLKTENKVFPYLKRGRMSGRPTRTMIQLMCQLACPEK